MTKLSLAGGFAFANFERLYREILATGYRVITLRDYLEGAFAIGEKTVVNRVYVDVKIERLPRLLGIYKKVTKDTSEGETWMGVPARHLNKLKELQRKLYRL